jgi:hypothetical protein
MRQIAAALVIANRPEPSLVLRHPTPGEREVRRAYVRRERARRLARRRAALARFTAGAVPQPR